MVLGLSILIMVVVFRSILLPLVATAGAARVAATSSEVLKLLPLNASLRAAETVSISTIADMGLIN